MLNFYKEGLKKNSVPLILCFFIVTCCMYVYSPEYLWLFMIITAVIQTTVFSFYTYIAKKSMLMRFISILGSFVSIALMVMIALKTGNNKSSIDYFIWFLSPQALVDFSVPYIAATFIIINFFIASTVYYFSAVRYRISMTFMITLIPFAVYRKEGEQVPVIFALILLVMYMALMIHCRQITPKPRQKFIADKGYRKSMILFLAFTSLIAVAVPKPDINIDNSWVETVFESERMTNYMLKRLGIVSETASSSGIYSGSSDIKLYEIKSDEVPLNLKSQTYSLYDFDNNIWRTSEEEVSGYEISDTYAEMLNPADFYKSVSEAALLDEEFAEKYNLSDIKWKTDTDCRKSFTMLSSRVPSKYFYTPVLSYSVTTPSDISVYRASQGMLFADGTSGFNYTVKYYSDSFIDDKGMQQIVLNLNNENFPEFIDDIRDILEKNEVTGYSDVLDAYYRDYWSSMVYLDEYSVSLPESVHSIAEKIVRKRNSDYEKALAIQNYFNENDFVYSLSYKKPENYNMEFFLTEGRTGICSDYATAMVLLSREVGIPARYAEGIHLHDPDENGIVTVKDSDLHAFPELYISGFGWMSFEPTQIGQAETGTSFDFKMSAYVSAAAVFLILLILVFNRFIYPFLAEKLFLYKVKKSSDEESVEMIFVKIRKLFGLEPCTTSAETGKYIREVYGIDIDSTVKIFDRVIYGGEKIGEELGNDVLSVYTKLFEIKKEEKKSGKNKF